MYLCIGLWGYDDPLYVQHRILGIVHAKSQPTRLATGGLKIVPMQTVGLSKVY